MLVKVKKLDFNAPSMNPEFKDKYTHRISSQVSKRDYMDPFGVHVQSPVKDKGL